MTCKRCGVEKVADHDLSDRPFYFCPNPDCSCDQEYKQKAATVPLPVIRVVRVVRVVRQIPTIKIEADVSPLNADCLCALNCNAHYEHPCTMIPDCTISISNAEKDRFRGCAEHTNVKELTLCEHCVISYVHRIVP